MKGVWAANKKGEKEGIKAISREKTTGENCNQKSTNVPKEEKGGVGNLRQRGKKGGKNKHFENDTKKKT